MNFLGFGWVTAMSIAFIPEYIHILGVSALGLIGIYTLLQTWMTLMDGGLRPTLSREMARWKGGAKKDEDVRDLLRSAELLALVFGTVIALTLLVLSQPIVHGWLNVESRSYRQAIQAVRIMGVLIALRFGESLYKSALIGLHRQGTLNAVQAINATLRYLGVIPVLLFIEPTISMFFLWQLIVCLLTVISFRIAAWSALPRGERRPRFQLSELYAIRKYAGGVALINLLVVCLTQFDKIILSAHVSLSDFGYYTVATTLAGGLLLAAVPVTQAAYPTLVSGISSGDDVGAVSTYRQSLQLLVAIVAPAVIILVVFAPDILFVWSGDAGLAERTGPILRLLAAGYFLNALTQMPFLLQLAHGRTKPLAIVFTVALCGTLPALMFAIPRYGDLGAAATWLLLNIFLACTVVPLTYRSLLSGQFVRWCYKDFLASLSGPLILLPIALLATWLLKDQRIDLFLVFAAYGLMSYLSLALTCDPVRMVAARLSRRQLAD